MKINACEFEWAGYHVSADVHDRGEGATLNLMFEPAPGTPDTDEDIQNLLMAFADGRVSIGTPAPITPPLAQPTTSVSQREERGTTQAVVTTTAPVVYEPDTAWEPAVRAEGFAPMAAQVMSAIYANVFAPATAPEPEPEVAPEPEPTPVAVTPEPAPEPTPAQQVERVDVTTPGSIPEPVEGAEYTHRGLYAKVQKGGRVAYQWLRPDGTRTPPQPFDVALEAEHPWAVAKAAEKAPKATRAKSATAPKTTVEPAAAVTVKAPQPTAEGEEPDATKMRVHINTHVGTPQVVAPKHAVPVPVTDDQVLVVNDPPPKSPGPWLHTVGVHNDMASAKDPMGAVSLATAQIRDRWPAWAGLSLAEQGAALLDYFETISELPDLANVHALLNSGSKNLRSPAFIQAVIKVAEVHRANRQAR